MLKIKIAIFLTIVALFLLTPAIATAHDEMGGMVMEVNGYHVRLIMPDVVRMGANPFQVIVTGADGKPVSGAMLEAAAQPVSEQPSHGHDPAPAADDHDMGGMPGMDMSTPAPAAMEHGGGHADKTVKLAAAAQAGLYEGVISFSKDGRWALTIHLMIGNEMLNVEFPLMVAYATPAGYGILAAFLGLNVVIIASAATLRSARKNGEIT